MPQPRYILNDSEMKAPGVYVKENAPPVPVRGQRNRVIGFAGVCFRGPTGRAVEISTYQRFVDVFGGRDRNTNGGAILGHVWKALQGKRWGKIFVHRVLAAADVKASFTLETAAGGAGTQVLRIDAANPGLWGNDVQWRVAAASNGVATQFNLEIKLYGKLVKYENININTASDDNTNMVIGNDDATLITLTKLANGRPFNSIPSGDGADTSGFTFLGQVVAAFVSVVGTTNAVVDTDYTAANGPMEVINYKRGIHACAVVGLSNAAIRTKASTLSGLAAQRVWFVTTDAATTAAATAVTERAAFNSQRLTYWFNHVYIKDPITDEEIVEEPFLFPMSVISQTDPDIHVGDFDNAPLYKAARRVQNQLGDPDRDTLTVGGVSFMTADEDQNGNAVIIAGNAVTCDFAINNKDLDGRYMKDFILDALAKRMMGDQFKGNTPGNRAARAGACISFLADLARRERYIAKNEETGAPQFTYVNDGSVNAAVDQATGLQKELLVATFIPKNIQIQLLATVGVDAVISEQ